MTDADKLQAECAALKEALEFYAGGKHFAYCGSNDHEPDTASGEPTNWMCGGAEGSEFQYENGYVAQYVLATTTAGSDLLAERERDRKRIEALEWMLGKAVKYLQDGKRQFAPTTTNSMVDEFLTQYVRMKADDALKANATGGGGGT